MDCASQCIVAEGPLSIDTRYLPLAVGVMADAHLQCRTTLMMGESGISRQRGIFTTRNKGIRDSPGWCSHHKTVQYGFKIVVSGPNSPYSGPNAPSRPQVYLSSGFRVSR